MLISRAKIAQKNDSANFCRFYVAKYVKEMTFFPFFFTSCHEVELLWWLKTLMLWFCHLWPLTVSFVAFDDVICGI